MQNTVVDQARGANKGDGYQIKKDHALIGEAEKIPIGAPSPVVSISPLVFVFADLGAIVLAVTTISFQAIKAAVMNPVKSLRTE